MKAIRHGIRARLFRLVGLAPPPVLERESFARATNSYLSNVMYAPTKEAAAAQTTSKDVADTDGHRSQQVTALDTTQKGPLHGRRIAVLHSKATSASPSFTDFLKALGADVTPILIDDFADARIESKEENSRSSMYDSILVDVCYPQRPDARVDPTDRYTQWVLFSGAKQSVSLIKNNGRILWIGYGRNDSTISPENSDNRIGNAALEGIVRSQAKEIGKKGVTANMISLSRLSLMHGDLSMINDSSNTLGSLQRPSNCIGPLCYLLGPSSAYVTGQRLDLEALPYTDTQKEIRRESDTNLRTGKPLKQSEQVGSPVPLTGRVAVVTGAAQGIGYSTCIELSVLGVQVVAVDVESKRTQLRQLATKIGGSFVCGDLREQQMINEVAAHVQDHYLGFDLLIHCAGITKDRTLKKMEYDEFRQVVDTNFKAIKRLDEALLAISPTGKNQLMLMRHHGRIIYLSSINGIAGAFGQANYAYTKSGLIEYARHMGEWLPKHCDGCTANAVAPGYILTGMTSQLPLMTKLFGQVLTTFSQGGYAQDVSNAIAMLCLPSSGGINGKALRVCGGHLQGK
eukprot:gb/GECG01001697.1/.p1 GENE.gb/GECG01001697.1/~~gb/GECG01001697.1/.p1  ORF type:complete len:571 (+),score=53.82 gb/GECG01001697.1/:1-1713(+)